MKEVGHRVVETGFINTTGQSEGYKVTRGHETHTPSNSDKWCLIVKSEQFKMCSLFFNYLYM